MTARRIVAVNAGLGDPSSTRLLIDRAVDSVVAQSNRSGAPVDVTVIDLRDIAAEIARSMVAGFALNDVADALATVYEADGLIVATPVFNASYSGLFKSFFDLVDVDRMRYKPVLIAATGGSPRHSMVLDHALRPLFSYLRAVVMPTGVYAAAEDWAAGAADPQGITARINRATRELLAAMNISSSRQVTEDMASTSRDDAVSDVERAGIATFARLLGEH